MEALLMYGSDGSDDLDSEDGGPGEGNGMMGRRGEGEGGGGGVVLGSGVPVANSSGCDADTAAEAATSGAQLLSHISYGDGSENGLVGAASRKEGMDSVEEKGGGGRGGEGERDGGWATATVRRVGKRRRTDGRCQDDSWSNQVDQSAADQRSCTDDVNRKKVGDSGPPIITNALGLNTGVCRAESTILKNDESGLWSFLPTGTDAGPKSGTLFSSSTSSSCSGSREGNKEKKEGASRVKLGVQLTATAINSTAKLAETGGCSSWRAPPPPPPSPSLPPPLPQEFLTLFGEKSGAGVDEERGRHQGRIRSFPHVEGNFACHVYIRFPVYIRWRGGLESWFRRAAHLVPGLKSIEEATSSPLPLPGDGGQFAGGHLLMNAASAGLTTVLGTRGDSSSAAAATATAAVSSAPGVGVRVADEYHVSLSRTVAIRFAQIDSVVAMLKKKFRNQKRFVMETGRWEAFHNDERTRSFLALQIAGGASADPRPHISVAWLLGDAMKELTSAAEMLNREMDMFAKAAPHCEGTGRQVGAVFPLKVDVTEVICRIGQRLHVFPLKVDVHSLLTGE